MTGAFKVARNPDPESRLPYLIRLPLEGGIVLKAREPWPRLARVYCSHEGTAWDEGAGLVDEAAILVCHRRGAAIAWEGKKSSEWSSGSLVDMMKSAEHPSRLDMARGRGGAWQRSLEAQGAMRTVTVVVGDELR